MRVSSQQIFERGLAGITNANAEVNRTQEQIATGRRVVRPSDDPVASTRILEIETELSLGVQYRRNIDNVEGRLELAETQIQAVELALQRIQELMVQAGGPAISNDDREFIAIEIEQRLQEVFGLVNSQDANGDHLFAGYSVAAPPFAEIGDGYVYQGDEGQRFEQIASGLQVAGNLTGKELFTNIPVANNDVFVSKVGGDTSGVGVSRGRVVDQAAYDAVFPDEYVVTFNALGGVAPAGPNYAISERAGGQVVAANVAFSLGDAITFNGIEVRLDGVPDPGETFLVEATGKRDMLSTLERIVDDLASFPDGGDSGERTAFLIEADENIDNIMQSLLQGRSKIGARLNTLETARNTQDSLDLANNEIVSELRDLDYAEAVSRLTFQSFVLEAAQSSFVRISSLSLFNFLR